MACTSISSESFLLFPLVCGFVVLLLEMIDSSCPDTSAFSLDVPNPTLPLIEMPKPSVKVSDVVFGAVTGGAYFSTRVVSMDHTWIPAALANNATVMVFAEKEGTTPFTSTPILSVSMDPITYIHGLPRGKWDHAGSAFKFYAAIRRMATHSADKKFYFIGDDDTLVFPRCIAKNLTPFLSHKEPLWFGQKCGDSPKTFCGGAGLVINHAALMLLNERLSTCLKTMSEYYGDVMISKCFHTLSVPFTEVSWMRSQPPLWYWTEEGKKEYPEEKGTKHVCTFHYLDKKRMKEMADKNLFTDPELFEMTYDEHRQE